MEDLLTPSPALHFLGWNKPAVKLVAEKLLAGLRSASAARYRRATVVVPTAESGRRLREYLAEIAGAPILTPRISLAGQLIPCEGEAVATEPETLAAWLQVLSEGMKGKSLPWVMDIATQMQGVRKQLEQEVRTPDWQEDVTQRFVQEHLNTPETQWQQTLSAEKERWEALKATFAGVDARLQQWHKLPAEQVRARELEHPRSRGLVIIACVPELSPLNRLYLQRLEETGAAPVEIWVNAPEEEAGRFDRYGQPIPIISEGDFIHRGWSECSIDIPRLPHAEESAGTVREEDVIHPTGSVQAFGRKVRELAGGHDSDQIVPACCDGSLAPVLVSSFMKEWPLNLPEGRSLLATEAGILPRQLRDACSAFSQEGQNSSRGMEDFLALLRNHCLQCCLVPDNSLQGFNRYLTELCFEYLPASVSHLLHCMQKKLRVKQELGHSTRKIQSYIAYTEQIEQLVHDCTRAATLPGRLHELATALLRHLTSPQLKRAGELLGSAMRETANLVENRSISCSPLMSLFILVHSVEKKSGGVLEGAKERTEAVNLRGWRELSYTTAEKVIIAGMHDGCVPERLPADSYLPNAYRSFLNMTNDTTRCARDSFLLTALLHSRPPGAVHFVLSSSSPDGTPISPSPLLLRCQSPAETARRVSRLFAEPEAQEQTESYDLLPFLSPATTETGADSMESIHLIAPDITNPYSDPQYTYSPSSIKSFLECPLRFWLNRLLGVNPGDALEDSKSEPDAAEYGTLLHAVLQDITSRYNEADSFTDEESLTEEIQRYAEDCTQARVRESYGDGGNTLPVLISLLLHNMGKTTQAFARQHARDLREGWEVIMMEKDLEFTLPAEDDGEPLRFKLRVDRVDRHRDKGTLRVIDYKTNATDPRKTHWEKLQEEAAMMYAHYMPAAVVHTPNKGASYRWNSVQLPLYAEALRQTMELDELPETGFYNMPRNAPGTVSYTPLGGVETKSAMSDELHAEAIRCVQTAAALMRSGRCLYSAEALGRTMRYNSFGALSIYKDPDPRVLCGLPALEVPVMEEN